MTIVAVVCLRNPKSSYSSNSYCNLYAEHERLHLNHERPLHETCHRWRAALPSCGAPRSWDDGLDGAALCHDLFGVCACASGVNGEACVRFRCGPPRDAEDGTRVLQFVDHAYCHRS